MSLELPPQLKARVDGLLARMVDRAGSWRPAASQCRSNGERV